MTKYVNPVPFGKGYLLEEGQSFLARAVELPDDVADALVRKTKEFELIQGWLAEVYRGAASRNYTVEVPDSIKEIVCPDQPSAEAPKRKDTEAPSSKPSRKPRKKTSSKSSTSPKTAE